MAGLALFLALILLSAAAHKAVQRDRLALVVARLLSLSAPIAALVLALAAVLEAVAALAILMPATSAGGFIAAAAIWAAYALALLRRRGAVLDCGCDFVAREKPVGWVMILRPALLAALAALCALAPSAAWSVETPFAAAALIALWFAASELAALPANAHRHRRASQ